MSDRENRPQGDVTPAVESKNFFPAPEPPKKKKKAPMIIGIVAAVLLVAALGGVFWWQAKRGTEEVTTEKVTAEEVPTEEVTTVHAHLETIIEGVEPTCTETGLTEGKKCADCGITLVPQTDIDALGHSSTHNDTPIVTAPTATEDGYIEYTCSRCGDVYTEMITPVSFTVDQNNRSQIGYTGKSGEKLVIPAVFQNDNTWYRVASIDYFAFESCTGLTSIKIPNSVTGIGRYAFWSCTGLTSIDIPDSVTSIGDYAFCRCTGLTSIEIPDSVTSIGNGAFSACDSLTEITVEVGNSIYHSGGNCLIETESKTLIAGCKTSIIPADGSVTSISDLAFYVCTGLTSIVIPDNMTRIGALAFLDCTGLTSITYEGTMDQWNAITKDFDWNQNVPATEVICTDGTVPLN